MGETTDLNPGETGQAGDAKDRAAERSNFFLSANVRIDPYGQATVRVRNLSAGGMMIEFAEEPDPELEIGQRLVAELRNVGRLKGEIAWTAGKRFGVKFDKAIDPEAVRKPVTVGEGTPDFIKPVLVPSRSLKYVEGLKGW